jgi:hypothetical protein
MATPDYSKYSKKSPTSGGLDLSKYSKTKSEPTKSEPSDVGKYVAMFLRGAAGFAPGGPIGAGIAGAAELGAQTLEGREHYNFPSVVLEAGMGMIPFHGAATVGKAALKGAGISALGTGLHQQTDEGLHLPSSNEVNDIALSGLVGGVGGGVLHKGAEFLEKYRVNKTPKVKAETEVNKAVSAVKETPINTAPKVELDTPKVIKEGTITPEKTVYNKSADTKRLDELITAGGTGNIPPEAIAEAKAIRQRLAENSYANEVSGQKAPRLPKGLQGAKPKYGIGQKQYLPQFENDIDTALYIIAGAKKSPAHDKYVAWLTKTTGLEGKELQAAARSMKAKLKIYMKDQPVEGIVKVPKLHDLDSFEPVVPTGRIRKNDPAIGKNIQGQIESGGDVIDPNTGEVISSSLPEPPRAVIPPNQPPIIPPDNIPPTSSIPEEPTASTVNRKIVAQSPLEHAVNISKTTSSMGDLSYGFRQGLPFIRRKEWRDSWGPMIKALRKSEYEKINSELIKHPDFQEAVDNGVSFTSLGDDISKREEHFYSNFLHNFPAIGTHLIAPSERAFNTFGNTLKLKVYESMKKDAMQFTKNPSIMGMKTQTNINNKEIANYINMMTGRGNIALTMQGKSEIGERAARALNTVFFSPRFVASRIQMLNPATYYKMDPFTRKEAVKDLGAMAGLATSALYMAKLAGADVEANPTKADFGKIKVGNTRIDALGGFGQYITLYSRALNHLREKESWSGNDKTKSDKADLVRFAESKASPTVTMLKEIYSGKNYLGQHTTIPETVLKGFAPMLMKDIWETYHEDRKNLPLTAAGILGFPVSSYGEKTKGKKNNMFSLPFKGAKF